MVEYFMPEHGPGSDFGGFDAGFDETSRPPRFGAEGVYSDAEVRHEISENEGDLVLREVFSIKPLIETLQDGLASKDVSGLIAEIEKTPADEQLKEGLLKGLREREHRLTRLPSS